MTEMLKIKKYMYRDDFILRKVEKKSVLHLGCIGETDSPLELKVKKASYLLHQKLEQVASEVFGIDIDSEAVKLYTQKLGKKI